MTGPDRPFVSTEAIDAARDAIVGRRLMAILRSQDHGATVDIAVALAAGGIGALEITVQTDAAFAALERVRDALPSQVVLGAGTVLEARQGQRALDSGASFLVSPHLDLPLHDRLRRAGALHVPGVATPSDIQSAARIGCDFVKLFPAGPFGTDYLRAIRGPFPEMRFMATGGIDVPDARRWLEAGAAAVGIGGALMPAGIPSDRDLADLTLRARSLATGLALSEPAQGGPESAST